MARPVYSDIIGVANSVTDAGALVATVPAGYTYVVRFAAATFGSFVAYVNCCLYRNGVDPRLWLMSAPQGQLFNVHPITFFWEGRMVFVQGDEIWCAASAGDACDVYLSGYVLTAS